MAAGREKCSREHRSGRDHAALRGRRVVLRLAKEQFYGKLLCWISAASLLANLRGVGNSRTTSQSSNPLREARSIDTQVITRRQVEKGGSKAGCRSLPRRAQREDTRTRRC